jgi:hypothetical protein
MKLLQNLQNFTILQKKHLKKCKNKIKNRKLKFDSINFFQKLYFFSKIFLKGKMT